MGKRVKYQTITLKVQKNAPFLIAIKYVRTCALLKFEIFNVTLKITGVWVESQKAAKGSRLINRRDKR